MSTETRNIPIITWKLDIMINGRLINQEGKDEIWFLKVLEKATIHMEFTREFMRM